MTVSVLSHEQRHQVAVCVGIYTTADIARHYGVDRSIIARIRQRGLPCQAEGCPLTVELPNIWDTKVTPDLIVADAQILANRGYSLAEIAEHFGVMPETVQRAHANAGRTLRLHPYHTDLSVRNMTQAPGHELVMA